jgi:hypothetical protein
LSEQQKGTGSGLGDQFEQARQRVMSNDTVKWVMDSEQVKTIQQQIQTQGPELVERVKSLAGEAMVRRIAIQQDGRTLFEFPLALGLGGVLLAPQLAALGALAALLGNCTITVEREDGGGQGGSSGSSGTSGTTSGSTGSSGASGGMSGSTGSSASS